MPFVFDVEELVSRPLKRRRTLQPADMARRWWQDENAPQQLPNTEKESEDIQSGGVQEPNVQVQTEIVTSDRDELIQCIKRGQKPTWVPKPGLEALCTENNTQLPSRVTEQSNTTGSQTDRMGSDPKDTVASQNMHLQPRSTDPIERPPSALHAGDFTDQESHTLTSTTTMRPPDDIFSTSHHASSPERSFTLSIPKSMPTDTDFTARSRRARAPSLGSSLSSSFIMRVPTSPLVNAMNNTAWEPSSQQAESEPLNMVERGSRRRTMPPNAFQEFRTSPTDTSPPNFSRPLPQSSLRSEGIQPFQAFAAHRSLSMVTYQPTTNSKPSFPPRSRRPSFLSDISPRQRASMVGSFEESILRGRMSTAPSKPLEFVAQIGVLGKGNCPASLKCPAHVSVSFPAVFYSYPSTAGSRSLSDDTPSPYVGTIDLEHNLKPIESVSKRKRPSVNDIDVDPDVLLAHITGPENTSIGRALAEETRENKRSSMKAPPGGAYRVPQQGQLQIVIKNPNKTAVKLFLVPYDLEGMQPGTKTFIRQRSFSSGPVVENVLSDNAAATTLQDPLVDKHILRYLIHLRFCSPSKGRFYLYDNVRVVFANRVPDGKEKLRMEVQVPDPKFSPYKPANSRRGSVSDTLIYQKPQDYSFPHSSPTDEMTPTASHELQNLSFRPSPIPFTLASRFKRDERSQTEWDFSDNPNQANNVIKDTEAISPGSKPIDQLRPQSPVAGFGLPSTSARASPVPWSPDQSSPDMRSFSPTPPEAGNSLLSKKLRELHKMQQQTRSDQNDGGI